MLLLHTLYSTTSSVKHFGATGQSIDNMSCSSKDFAKWGIVVSAVLQFREGSVFLSGTFMTL